VVQTLSSDGYRDSADLLCELWIDRDRLRERCRQTADTHVSLDRIGARRYQEVYQQLSSS